MNGPKCEIVTVRMTNDQRVALAALARHFDRSESDTMRRLIEAAATALPETAAPPARGAAQEDRP